MPLITQMMYCYTGLPHSDTRGSKCLGHSPQLFAALRVLLRLQEPRHPPYALTLDLLLKSFIGKEKSLNDSLPISLRLMALRQVLLHTCRWLIYFLGLVLIA